MSIVTPLPSSSLKFSVLLQKFFWICNTYKFDSKLLFIGKYLNTNLGLYPTQSLFTLTDSETDSYAVSELELNPLQEEKYISISAKDFPSVSGIFRYRKANPTQLITQNSQKTPWSSRLCSRCRYDLEAVNMNA